MISHGIVDGPHGLILARIPGDAGPLAELVRGHYVGERWLREVRDLAALLAESRPVHHLLPLFGRVPVEPDTWAELIACLAQELVVRRVNLTRVPAAVRCADALRESGHPLAGLPLRLGRGGGVAVDSGSGARPRRGVRPPGQRTRGPMAVAGVQDHQAHTVLDGPEARGRRAQPARERAEPAGLPRHRLTF